MLYRSDLIDADLFSGSSLPPFLLESDDPYVSMVVSSDAAALKAFSAGFILGSEAVDSLSQVKSQGSFANVGWSYEKIGVGETAFFKAGFELVDCMFLTNDLPHNPTVRGEVPDLPKISA